MRKKCDFAGWATKNDLLCSDGRIIRKDAFKDNDGNTVPLVWMHQHDDPENVLGHALLENRDDGVYAYCTFNGTEKAQHAKALVEHGDVVSLSIYANKLKQNGTDVLHGVIREVSLVLAGANPGAHIEQASIAHSDGSYTDLEDEATIFTGEESIEISHADDTSEEKEEAKEENSEKTVGEVLNTLTEEQKVAVGSVIRDVLENKTEEVEHSDEEGEDTIMKHNVFDVETGSRGATLSHDDFNKILTDAKRLGSLKASVEEHKENGVLAHAGMDLGDNPSVEFATGESTYGFNDPDMLFPDARMINNVPEWIKRDTGWVSEIMNGSHHTPFSRIKSMFANITEDQARAKGYIKGKQKKDQVFSLLKRTTTPQTIYKKQKLDRDDIIDITSFDVVAWIKGEMRMMLDEEIARAALIGDGRENSDDDKISPDHIRPIAADDDLFTIKVDVTLDEENPDDNAHKFIRSAIKARKNYKGTGSPILFTTEDMLSDMLLMEDGLGHALYVDEAALARKLRVRKIVTVPVMEGTDYLGIIVNPFDYNFGADKGGAVSMFDDFDIDVNQQKYLIETRCSGALVRPFSAIVLRKAAATEDTPDTPVVPGT